MVPGRTALPVDHGRLFLRRRRLDDVGVAGVFIGHNADIAWGFTNLGPDVTDLVLEKVTGDNYEIDGKKQPLTTRQEVIKVAGGEDVTITVRSTPNGPIMSDVLESTAAAGDSAPVPAPGQAPDSAQAPPKGSGYAVALKWTALTPRPTFDAFDMMNTAENWDDFRKAAEFVSVPAQNLLYADTSGRIGYQAPGSFRSGRTTTGNGRFPAGLRSTPGPDRSHLRSCR